MNTPANNAMLIAMAAAPLMGPNAQLAMMMAQLAGNAVRDAQALGLGDISDEQLAALFARDDIAKAADKAAQDAVRTKRGGGGGGPVQPL
jgi:hypothetical protein